MKNPAEGGGGLPCCNAEPQDKWKENNITNEISETTIPLTSWNNKSFPQTREIHLLEGKYFFSQH